jgi:shikimate dehydrogenase
VDSEPALIRLAVFGNPVRQSLSPEIHRRFAGQFGLDIEYQAIEATPATFAEQVANLALSGGRGCNVTVPFKHEAWKLAGRHSAAAERAEAANTLDFAEDDWFADNTDGGGLVDDLSANEGIDLTNKRICLLGAGGAAAGVLGALLTAGAAQILIANRTVQRAVALVERHRDLGPVAAGGPDDIATHAPFDLLINATSVGHLGRAPEVDADWFRSDGLCYDMNYGPAARPLRGRCLQQGIAFRDGLGMLVCQAARSFRLWTGRTPDARAVLDGLRAAAGE